MSSCAGLEAVVTRGRGKRATPQSLRRSPRPRKSNTQFRFFLSPRANGTRRRSLRGLPDGIWCDAVSAATGVSSLSRIMRIFEILMYVVICDLVT